MQFAGLLQQNLEGRKIPSVSQVLMEQKVYTQSDDIPALGSKAAGFPWSWTGRNPTGLGRRQGGKRQREDGERQRAGYQERLFGILNRLPSMFKIMFPGILYKPPMILQG